MEQAPQTQDKQNLEFSLRQNDIRALICYAAAATVFVNMDFSAWSSISVVESFIALSILVYTSATYIWLKKKSHSDRKDRYFDVVMTIDAAVIGVVLSYSNFSLLPTVLFVTMVQFNSLINGGLKKWGIDNIALIAGMALTFIVKKPNFVFEDKFEISAVSLIGIFTYFCAYALYAHNRMNKLLALTRSLEEEKVSYKLRAYKLSRYLSPTVWKAINEGREDMLKTERKRVTVFFSDIRGFSSMSEELESETLTDILNTYLTEMSNIVNKYGGTIDKFMGDAIMVLFGDSESEGLKRDAMRCLSMAIDMRRKMKELQTRWYNQGVKNPLSIRMGINTGYCSVGSYGTSHYMDYTVLGTHVNLASRLETAAKPGEILISHETWSLVKDSIMCRDKGNIKVKGFTHPVKVYEVVDFRKDLGKDQSYFECNAEGFSMHLDLDKIRNYDKNTVLNQLKDALLKLKDKHIS